MPRPDAGLAQDAAAPRGGSAGGPPDPAGHLPEQIPVVPAFDIDGWNEPADETGGDTYDVIGCRHEPGEDGSRLVSTDAQGWCCSWPTQRPRHWPALSSPRCGRCSGWRSASARIWLDRPSSECAALCRPHRGRFVTAWVGELDARERTLRSFSCGQGRALLPRRRARRARRSRPTPYPSAASTISRSSRGTPSGWSRATSSWCCRTG